MIASLLKQKKSVHLHTRLFWISFALFSLALSAFITSTVAWFAVSDFLQLNNIAVTYDSSDFEVGMKGNDGTISYSSSFTTSDETSFTPVSSMYEEKWYQASDLTDETLIESVTPRFMETYADATGYTHETPYANDGFYQAELFFRSSKDVYVFLDSTTSLAANEKKNELIAEKNNIDVSSLDGISNCLRASFYGDLGYTIYEPNVDKSSETPFYGRLDVNPCDGYYDYSTNSEGISHEILYGDYDYQNATIAYDNPVGGTVEKGTSNGFDAKTNPLAYGIDLEKSGNVNGVVEKTYSLSELTLSAATSHPILFVPAGTTRRLVLSIYVEGWDKDCTNAVKDAYFTASIVFSGRYGSESESGD